MITSKGSALISALFIMTLVAIATTAISMRIQLDIYRTSLTLQTDRLYLASQLISFWAMSELSNKEKTFATNLGKEKVAIFPASLEKLVPGFFIKGNLYALQGRLNLNNMVDKTYNGIFLRLLQQKIADQTPEGQKRIALSLRQWLSPYLPGRGQDEFFSYYLQQKPPYYPSQQLMQNPSELRLLFNISAQNFVDLSDFITVLPETLPININFASKPILMSLGNGLNESQVSEIIDARSKTGSIDKKDLSNLLNKLQIESSQVTIENQYFLAVAEVKSQDASLSLYSIFKRQLAKNGDVILDLMSETLNTL